MNKKGQITDSEVKAYAKREARLVERATKKAEKAFGKAIDRDHRYNQKKTRKRK
jgi:hypothetical protein